MLVYVVGTRNVPPWQREALPSWEGEGGVSLRTDAQKTYSWNIEKIHDAYVIAVEDEAREKLDRLAWAQQVQVVDMSQLIAPTVTEVTATTTVTSTVAAVSSVTTTPTAISSPTASTQQQHSLGTFVADTTTASAEFSANKALTCTTTTVVSDTDTQVTVTTSTAAVVTTQGLSARGGQGRGLEAKTSGKQRWRRGEGGEEFFVQQNPLYESAAALINSADPASMPGEKKKKNSPSPRGGFDSGTTNGGSGEESGEWMEMNGYNDTGKKNKGKRRSKNGGGESPAIGDFLFNGSINMNSNGSDPHYRNGGHSQLSGSYDLSRDSSFDLELDDPGPHREMAIDVPENFVASVKSPPRYPPPQVASSMHNQMKDRGNNSHSQTSLNSGANSTKHQSSSLLQPAAHPAQPTAHELERLHHHQEELKKRREEESRQQAEEDFLRASLRGSKKLQALENKKPLTQIPSGFVNTAFDDEDDLEDEEDDEVDDIEAKSQPRQLSDVMVEDRYLKKNIGVEDLFSSLHHIRSTITGPEDQKYIAFLRSLFQNDQFQQAVNLHCQVIEIMSRSPPVRPLTDDVAETGTEVQYMMTQAPHDPHAQELFALLSSPYLKSVLECQDAVAQQVLQAQEEMVYQGEVLDYPLVQYGEDSVKIIHLEKTNVHLGATVKNEGDSVIIGRIVKGGAAEESGLLHEGDEILEVNGVDMRGRNINEVSEMLANMSGTITFIIIPGHRAQLNSQQRSNIMHLRALFAYDPEDDPYIPCRELGISFCRGEILHAIALDDPNWWQAYREGEEEDQSLAGLIPSKSFTEQRVAMLTAMENKENKRKGRVCACGRKERKKKKKKKSLYNGGSEDAEETLTYEEISRYFPQPNRKRPIILIGPSNVGRQELQQRLIDSDPDRFGAPVPHTTRPRRASEVDGSNYHYISRVDFQAMIQQNQFVEYGEHQKNFYGTSVAAIRQLVAQGKVCMLKLQPESLKVVRASSFMPYVVFVRPPNLDKLRQLQDQLDKARPLEEAERGRLVFTDDQLKEIIDKAREIEELYSHYFDFVLVNSDLDRAYAELLEEINRIDMEPQWVPAAWVDSL
ncbi:MAGUK p55 subfamily member 5 isoform X2 [Aplysia californica]|uniref:MAGUK p55 subfamily member 5 isoform X2 n=1 Tax=Aplysia californica TaxID=6500 RepID=A0ABM0JQB7_APLCA|nr:MAGUK p55 subfamily member 5 isoform X2 [Aplysia californica]